jgi:parallel beta-helix repeat protein
MRYLTILFCAVVVLFSLQQARANICHVPADSSTIQGCINGTLDGDTVLVAEGYYYERINFFGKGILVTSEFMIDGDTLHIQNTIIDANTDRLGVPDTGSVVCFVNGEDSTSIIQGFTIQNGMGTRSPFHRRGGGVFCDAFSSPIITKCTVSGNTAEFGGGVLCEFCSFPTITNNTISHNQGFGGVYSHQCDSLTIANNTICGNQASDGGGIYLGFTNSPNVGDITITNNTISGNSGGLGGGIFCTDIGLPSITLISHNTIAACSAGQGGGICCKDYSSPTLSHNTIIENHALDGGGLYCIHDSSPKLLNTIIAFSTQGKAVHCDDATADPTLNCCDIYCNADGDWVACIEEQFGVNGNISCDPLFCYPDTGNYYLAENSCCAGAGCDSSGNPDSTTDIGAFGLGCDPIVVWYVSTTGDNDTCDGSQCCPFRTIQKGINAAVDGAAVLVADGTYTGEGNRDIDFSGRAITVRSRSGNPDQCAIDCGADSLNPHRGFHFHSNEGSESVVQGISITNGYAGNEGGGGIYCENTSPAIRDCVIENCSDDSSGGAMLCNDSSSPTLINCTFSDNSAESGGGMCCYDYSSPMLLNTIIAFSILGEAVYCDGSSSCSLTCCDVYDNAGGDSTECIENQFGINGNISCDPMFCDRNAGNYYLAENSCCVGAGCDSLGNPDTAIHIGALGVGCTRPNFTLYVSTVGDDDTCDGTESCPFRTIQKGINEARNGDTVLVTSDTYTGEGNRDIDFLGKAIIVRSDRGAEECTVDCWGGYRVDPHRGFYFHSGEGPESVLEGVTIMNGILVGPGNNRGAGILCEQSSPKIRDCRIIGNWATDGGAGAGICCDNASPTITRCTISGNRTDGNGGGIYWSNSSSPKIISCTISANRANQGGGLYGAGADDCPRNTIVWDNWADNGVGEEWYGAEGPFVECCNDLDSTGLDGFGEQLITCFDGGNICADPMFCSPEHWENAPTTHGNYCIHPNSPCTPDSSPKGCDLIGALGVGTLAGDCNGDGVIDIADVVYEINYLFLDGPPPDPMAAGDVNCDGVEDMADVIYKINYLFLSGSPPCCYCPD